MSDNAIIYKEAAQTAVAMVALTDSGDHTTFESADELWSNRSGYAPVVRPDGVVTGLVVTPGAAADTVAVSAGTCYLAGVLTSVGADAALSVPRPTGAAPTTPYQQISIIVAANGTLAIIEGTEKETGFATGRGATAGQAPLITAGTIEIALVQYSSQDAAVLTTSEIKAIPGESRELYNYPAWTENRMVVDNGALGNAGVTFDAALPLYHVGPTAKKVYASYYTPDFAEIPETSDFKPPETTHSTSSTQIYGKVKGSSSSALGQGSFKAFLNDGISDSLIADKDEFLFFKFKQNRLNTPYILCQGKLGISREFPADEGVTATCTISATDNAVEVIA